MTYALKDINPVYALNGISAGDAFRRAGDAIDGVAIGDDKAALLVLWARAGERLALGTLCEDEARALIALMV